MSHKYTHILAAFADSIWAILPAKFSAIRSFLMLKANGGEVSAEEIAEIKKDQREPVYFDQARLDKLVERVGPEEDIEASAPALAPGTGAGTVAVLPLSGTILHRMGSMAEMSGGISTERFSKWFQAALKDPNVKAIVIDCDSPGGTVYGVGELADEIYRGKAKKQIIGVANAMSASAAYYLLSQCTEVVVTPSGQVGSIGVFCAHEDLSKAAADAGVKVSLISAGKYKTEGNPFEPLSDEARQNLQNMVNDYYDAFTKAVARGRGVSLADVRSGFGEGRVVSAQDAVKAKMADRVATLDQTLSRLGATSSKRQLAAETDAPAVANLDALQAEQRARELQL